MQQLKPKKISQEKNFLGPENHKRFLGNEERDLFLKLFVEELIENSKPQIHIPHLPSIDIEEARKIMPIEEKPKTQIHLTPKLMQFKSQQFQPPIHRLVSVQQAQRQIIPRIIPQQVQPSQFQPPISIQPDFSKPIPQGFSLGKLDKLLKDPYINMIECPGPNKLILVRSINQIQTTKFSLNEEEIKQIIKNFSEAARIPLMTGIFKAAVGNLIITAIISEFVGSRFIISKRIG